MGVYDPLRVNQTIEIELPDDQGSRYRSRVEVIHDNRIVIASPLKSGSIIPLRPGIVVKLIYADNGAVYTFAAEVIAQNIQTPPTITLGHPYDVKRIQRRNFVRLDAKLNVTMEKVDDKLVPTGETFSGITADISGGGMMFLTTKKLTWGENLQATVLFSDDESVKAVGRVVRYTENPPTVKYKYSVGLEYTVIEEPERDKIIKFIFNRQRELRKKGLL